MTRSKQTELEQLKASNEEYKQINANLYHIINDSRNGMLIVNHEGIIQSANAFAHDLFNKPKNQLVGHEFGFPLIVNELAELDIANKDGTSKTVEMKVLNTKWNGEPAFLITLHDITELADTRTALQKNKKRLESIVNTASEGLWEIDQQGYIRFVNKAFLELINCKQDQIIGESIYELLDTDSIDHFKSILNNPQWITPIRFDCKITTRTKEIKWVLVSLTLIKDENDLISGALGMFTDITDRKMAEDILVKTNAKLNLFIENTYLAYVEIDKDFRIIGLNKSAEKMFGYTENEALNKSADIIIPKEEKQHAHKIFKTLLRKAGGFEEKTYNQHKNGKLISCLWMNGLVTNNEGEVQSVIALAREITQEQKKIAAIEESQKNLSFILSALNAAVFTLDSDLSIKLCNKTSETLFKYNQNQLKGKPIQELFSEDYRNDILEGILNFVSSKAKTYKSSYSQTIYCQKKNGDIFDADISITKINIMGQDMLIALLTDITDRKQQQQKLMRSMRLESIGMLTSGIVHEMNDVLTPILLSLEYLKYLVTNPDAQECLISLENSSKKGQALIEQLLTFATGKESQHTVLNASRLLYDVESILQDTFPKNISINLDINEQLWSVITHPSEFQQIMLNICMNARDAMPEGGSLRISAKNTVIDENYVQQNAEASAGPFIQINLTDTGQGIKAVNIQKIFDPFFSTKLNSEGSGLGLSTVYSLVKNHGGFIDASSKVNQGTTLSVFLPASQPKSNEESDKPAQEIPLGHGETILVVDDEPAILSMTENILKRHQYKVLKAQDGSEALAIFTQHKSDIDCAIVDMMMPIMDGHSTIQALLAIKPEMNILAVSGLIDTSGLKAKYGKQVSNLAKPYTADTLLLTLSQLLN